MFSRDCPFRCPHRVRYELAKSEFSRARDNDFIAFTGTTHLQCHLLANTYIAVNNFSLQSIGKNIGRKKFNRSSSQFLWKYVGEIDAKVGIFFHEI